MKKSLILLLVFTMIISLLFVSCENNSQEPTGNETSGNETGGNETGEKTFTEENYQEILKKNNSTTVSLDVFENMTLSSLEEISGEFKLSSDKGFSLLTSADLKSQSGDNTEEEESGKNNSGSGDSGETEAQEPNIYEYILVKATIPISALTEPSLTEDTSTTGDSSSESESELLTITYKLKTEAGEGTTEGEEAKGTTIKLSDIMGESEDPLAKELQILMSKAMSSEGESKASIDISFKNYLEEIIAVGAATPEITLSVEVKDESEKTVKIELSEAKLGGNSETRTLTFGGTLAVTKDESNIVSLGSNVSITFGEGFDIEYKSGKKGEKVSPTLKGSVSFDVTDIKLAFGPSIVVAGNIKGSATFDGENTSIKAGCNLTETLDEEEYIVTSFNINYDETSDGLIDALTFTEFKVGDVTYSGESVKAVFKKVLESKNEQA